MPVMVLFLRLLCVAALWILVSFWCIRGFRELFMIVFTGRRRLEARRSWQTWRRTTRVKIPTLRGPQPNSSLLTSSSQVIPRTYGRV